MALVLSACGHRGPGGPAHHSSSGIVVVTTVDGGCPVERAGSACPPQPILAKVDLRRVGSPESVGSATTGPDGMVRLRAAPGRYVVVARVSGTLPMEQVQRKTVEVRAGSGARVTFRFDSGIRVPLSR
ncbi:MAG: carboxypeptidase-like regulatory domain-containing protein [Actinomycetota bacterium]|nr:carboxypeptidase-like regulatory domain-containing protein [Actinomycetota bacterium]